MCKPVQINFNYSLTPGEPVHFIVDFTPAFIPGNSMVQPEGPEMNIVSTMKWNGDSLSEQEIDAISDNDELWNKILLVAEETYNKQLERKLF